MADRFVGLLQATQHTLPRTQSIEQVFAGVSTQRREAVHAPDNALAPASCIATNPVNNR